MNHKAPRQMVLVLAGTIMAIEILAMSILPRLQLKSNWLNAVVDAVVVTALIAPLLYHWVLKPLARQLDERQRLADTLREKEARYRTLVQAIPHGVLEMDVDGTITFANTAFETMSKVKPGAMIGRKLWELPAAPEGQSATKTWHDGVASDRQRHTPLNIKMRNEGSQEIDLVLDYDYRYNAQGEPAGSVAIITDVTQDKAARENLRLSEAKFATVFNNAPVMMTLSNLADGTYLNVNNAFLKVLGVTREEIVGAASAELDRISSDLQMQADLIRERGRVEGMELTLHARDGRVVECIYSGELVTINGQICLLSIGLDVTERKHGEVFLRESERRFRSLFEGSWDAMVTLAPPTWIFLSGNPAAVRLFRSGDMERLITLRPWDVSPAHQTDGELSSAKAKEMIGIAMEKGSHYFEWLHQRLDGEEFTASVLLTRIEMGGQSFLLGTVRDVHLQKKAEEALRTSEERLRLALEAAQLGSWERDLKTNRLFISSNLERMIGFEPDTFPGTEEALLQVLDPDCHTANAAAQKRAREGDGVYQAELHCRLRDGQERWFWVLGRLVRNSQGLPDRILGVAMDLTERKQLEIRLRQSQKMEAVGQLAGGVAHDFNNLLAAISLNLGLLQHNPAMDAETQDALHDLEATVARAFGLTRQLLLFSRRSILEVKPVNLNEVVDNLLKFLGRLIGEHIRLRFRQASSLPAIDADAGMLEQILMNLAVNARDAMPNGGQLTISTEVVEMAREASEHSPEARMGSFLCLTVSDNGCGMDEATQKRIFEPFFTTKEPGKGTGLGLSTVYGIVAQHRGWLEVQSQVAQGTTFRIFFPVSKAIPAAPSPGQNPVSLGCGHETILLVEDDEDLRNMVAMGLRKFGYQVLEAANGKRAMALWRSVTNPIHLLFVDMVMPGGITGLQLARQFKAERPQLKIIISSGYSTEASTLSKLADDSLLFLPKPFQISTLCNTVRSKLDHP